MGTTYPTAAQMAIAAVTQLMDKICIDVYFIGILVYFKLRSSTYITEIREGLLMAT